jgi:adenosylcobinamide kinase/adenosylcobinamide-phosphate guanylyltransferase
MARTLVLGGARSGKSTEAERRFADRVNVVYVATARPDATDEEWTERIEKHRARRPASWSTLETTEVPVVLRAARPDEPVLVDCLTLWATAVLDEGGWESGAWSEDLVDARIADLVAALRDTRADVVLVSNEVGQGVVPATTSGRRFRDVLGRVNLEVARECDEVLFMTAGLPTILKPLKETDAA